MTPAQFLWVIGPVCILAAIVVVMVWRCRFVEGHNHGYIEGLTMAQRIAEKSAWGSGASPEFGPEQNCIRVANNIRKVREAWESKP